MRKFHYGPRKITKNIAAANDTNELRSVVKASIGLPMDTTIVASTKLVRVMDYLENGTASFLDIPKTSGLNLKLITLMLQECTTRSTLDTIKKQLIPALQDKVFYLDDESEEIVSMLSQKMRELSQVSH